MDIDTKALRALREQATAGEWLVIDPMASDPGYKGKGYEVCSRSEAVTGWGSVTQTLANAALIAATVNNLIPLLDEIDRLRTENAALNSELAGHREWDEENQLDRAALYADMDEVE